MYGQTQAAEVDGEEICSLKQQLSMLKSAIGTKASEP